MTTLPLNVHDVQYVRQLHEKFYKEEFNLPDFTRNFLNCFKILNDNGRVVTAGGIRLFPELILITDQESSTRDRAFALTSAMQIATLVSAPYGNLFCSAPKDSKWHRQVAAVGFKESKDYNLVITL